MKKALALTAAILFAAIPVTAAQAAESADQKTDAQPSTQPENTSIKQGIKNDAAEVKRDVKKGAREVKQNVKSGAVEVKRKLAVAQCNDGRYSYTHHRTCNHHGGVKTRLR